MPQMAPMSWVFIYFFTIMSLMLICFFLYFSYLVISASLSNKLAPSLSVKWEW